MLTNLAAAAADLIVGGIAVTTVGLVGVIVREEHRKGMARVRRGRR